MENDYMGLSINRSEFRQLFNFNENDKDKKQLKKDFKKILLNCKQ